jgi:hypothetical protein
MGKADETPVVFDMLMNSAIDSKGPDSIVFEITEHEKQRITVML